MPEWSLRAGGRARAEAMLNQPWIADVGTIVSSPETKALETAALLGAHVGVTVDAVDASHEIDRSATGFVSHERHEALADELFGRPDVSADGWERASDAQRRIVECMAPLVQQRAGSAEHCVVVGHGGVGTLLLCHLLGAPIDRSFDQPGQGHYWSYDRLLQRVRHRWRPIDRIEPTIVSESPDQPEVIALLEAHLDFARQTSPPEHVHALDIDGLMSTDMTFCVARRRDQLLAVGALRDLGDGRAELKSMHTAAAARGEGIGRLMLEHLISLASAAGVRWVGLETGSMDAFAPARALYETAGFARCEPFGSYTDNEYSLCMSLNLRH